MTACFNLFNYANRIQALNGATGELIGNTSAICRRDRVGWRQSVLAQYAIFEDKLIAATADAHIVALDTKTGKVIWDHTTAATGPRAGADTPAGRSSPAA